MGAEAAYAWNWSRSGRYRRYGPFSEQEESVRARFREYLPEPWAVALFEDMQQRVRRAAQGAWAALEGAPRPAAEHASPPPAEPVRQWSAAELEQRSAAIGERTTLRQLREIRRARPLTALEALDYDELREIAKASRALAERIRAERLAELMAGARAGTLGRREWAELGRIRERRSRSPR